MHALLLRSPRALLLRPSGTTLLAALRSHQRRARQCSAGAASSEALGAGSRVVRAAHIMLPLGQESVLEELQQQLAAGADFAALAKEHSACASRQRGGDLGWITPGSALLPELQTAALASPLGATVRAATARGLHLVRVLQERMQAVVQHMSVQELRELLALPELSDSKQLVDVREEGEWDSAHLPGFKLLPLSRSAEWSADITAHLDPAKDTICLCHHGVRSMQMCMFLASQGFQGVSNVTGGIAAYSAIDPSVPTY